MTGNRDGARSQEQGPGSDGSPNEGVGARSAARRSSVSGHLPRLESALSEDGVLLDVEAKDFSQLAQALTAHLATRNSIPRERVEELEKKLTARQKVASTAIGEGMACPHAFVDFVGKPIVLFARLKQPIDLGAPDGVPTDLVFLLVGRRDDARNHLQTLMHLARLMQDERFPSTIRAAETADAVVRACLAAERRLEQGKAPPRARTREGIEARTGRFAGGLLADLRRRWPVYLSDYRDGLSLKALSASIFLYFACFSGAVTFGALTATETDGHIGPFEMILATAICGLAYAIFSGQPLVILGGTGPILIFTKILYEQCAAMELDFMATYACVGLWASGFTLLLALLDASVLLRYVTRFTDEIFVLVMAAIFLDEAGKKLYQEFVDLQGIGGYASALSAAVLALGTLGIALVLRGVRQGTFLRSWARNFLADFGTVIAIVCMSSLAYFMSTRIEDLQLDTIVVPSKFELALVSIRPLPTWVVFAAAIPAAFLAIMIFLTQQITAKVCNAPDFNLRKGPGYHLDLFVVGILLAFCSLFGLPWMCGATVRSLNHINALAETKAATGPGGAVQAIERVHENRVSGILIHVLVGLSLLLVSWLRLVPMATLYGIFLYMGIVSFAGNQFWQRLTLWFREPALYPPTHYLRLVPTPVVHLFTAVQTVCFAVLWAVKAYAGLLLPLFLALLVPVRVALGRFIPERYLDALDAEETPEDEQDHWA
ncbi:MAG: HCO3- transporter [Planctomycetota bacterium]|nr:MAG: HCO3- transporter [Planctomycetota bacterium]